MHRDVHSPGNVNRQFWLQLDTLVAANEITLDRPKHASHPHHPQCLYPLNYGYLTNTTAGDRECVDVWLGDGSNRSVVGVVCTVDLLKNVEVKLLLDCSPGEIALVQEFFSTLRMGHAVVLRSAGAPRDAEAVTIASACLFEPLEVSWSPNMVDAFHEDSTQFNLRFNLRGAFASGPRVASSPRRV